MFLSERLFGKLTTNITGITLGTTLFGVGILTFEDTSARFLKNLFIFFGLFLIVFFISNAVRQYVRAKDPNYDRETEIAALAERSKNAANTGKAAAFDMAVYLFAAMFIAFSLMGASWQMLAILLGAYGVLEAVALSRTAREYAAMRREQGYR